MTLKNAVTRPFTIQVPEEMLMSDLETFRQKALELGAAAAEIIRAAQINVDERVRLKCTVPRCLRAGETPNCPPYVPELDVIRKALARFSWGILLKTHLEPVKAYAPESKQSKNEQRSLLFHQKSSEIVYEIERLAYKSGYGFRRWFMQRLPVPWLNLPVYRQRQMPFPTAGQTSNGSYGNRRRRFDKQSGLEVLSVAGRP